MSDLSSRQDAIDAMCDAFSDWCKGFNAAVDHCIHHVIHAPTIEERNTGKWIVSDDKDWYTCPFCGADIDVSVGTGVYVDNDEVNHVNYCPNCGCKMEVEE